MDVATRIGHTMMQRPTWFRRFAEVPGPGYVGDSSLRAQLPDRDAIPEVHEFAFDGKQTASLSWPTRDGSTSASPSHRQRSDSPPHETIPQVRYNVLAALELPGEILDYHFAMQGAATELWRRRSEDPAQLAFIEWICWFDARLVEGHPFDFRILPEKEGYVSVFAFDFLVDFHEREGFLHEAFMLAERFARFRRGGDPEGLRERVARLKAEHV